MLVREGMGVALVPKSTLPEELRGLCMVPVIPPIHREFGLVCSKAGKSSLAMQDYLKGCAKEGVLLLKT
jgi:DNA-binding transcriptional LysR family regulator